MKIAILKERKDGELRVAASPETVKKLVELGATVVIEESAGEGASFPDADYKTAGAKVEKEARKVLEESDIILKVQPPFETIAAKTSELSLLPKEAVLVSLLSPFDYVEEISELAAAQVTAFSLEMVPRITRAQSMDVLASQSNLAGYKAVLDAVSELPKVVPMMMTAAGTIQPAKALILGAGVAGLQAIATAKRLGAVVSAFDVRPAVKEQVESLGASFVEVEVTQPENAETAGGYAKEMDEDYKHRQSELIAETIKDQDIVITTALIPGKPAPTLITKAMVKSMRPGSVIVDLAAIAGGNCEFTQKDKVVEKEGVTIIGHTNIPSRVAKDASQLYAKNVLNFMQQFIKKDDKGTLCMDINKDDEIIENTLLTYQGKIVHPLLKEVTVASGATKKRSSASTPKKVTKRTPHVKKQVATKQPTKKKPVMIEKVENENNQDVAWEEK